MLCLQICNMEAAGVGFQSWTSCPLLPARGACSRLHPCRLDRGASSNDRMPRGARSRSTPAWKMKRPPWREVFSFSGGGGSRTRVPEREPQSVYRFIRPFRLSRRGQRGGAPSLPYSEISPRSSFGPRRYERASVGVVSSRGRSRRRNRGPIAIGAYAARARVPLSLAQ